VAVSAATPSRANWWYWWGSLRVASREGLATKLHQLAGQRSLRLRNRHRDRASRGCRGVLKRLTAQRCLICTCLPASQDLNLTPKQLQQQDLPDMLQSSLLMEEL
jgi:hypothetical protein